MLFRKTRKTRRLKNAIDFPVFRSGIVWANLDQTKTFSTENGSKIRLLVCVWHYCSGRKLLGGEKSYDVWGTEFGENGRVKKKKPKRRKSPLLILRVFEFHLRVLTQALILPESETGDGASVNRRADRTKDSNSSANGPWHFTPYPHRSCTFLLNPSSYRPGD